MRFNWLGSLLGLVVCSLAAWLIAPLLPGPADRIIYVVAIIGVVIFAVLFLVALFALVFGRWL